MTRILTYLLSVVLLTSCTATLEAQNQPLTSTNKKAVKYFHEAKTLYDQRKDQEALDLLGKALDKDPGFIEAYLLKAAVYEEHRQVEEALAAYDKAIEINPRYDAVMFISAAALRFSRGEYDKVADLLKAYESFPRRPQQFEGLYQILKQNTDFAREAIKHPVPFEPKNMGPNINSELDEYFPCITADNSVFIYTRRLESNSSPTGFNEDFYISEMGPDGWKPSRNMGKSVNTPNNEGAAALSPNGQLLIYTVCEIYGNYGQNRKGYGSCDLFFTQWSGKTWRQPRNMGKNVNSSMWESQPTFSPDGRTLYYIRGNNRTGAQDIYKAVLGDDGYWQKPEKLSDVINTPGREEFVAIHPDGRTLYFASDGHPGMGGLDLFMSKMDENGEWGKPVNLGYPINTFKDESSILVDAQGKLAYFHSNRDGGFGGLDLYTFELPEQFRPDPVTYMKGKITDKKTGAPLVAVFELIDLETGRRVVESYSNDAGEFLVPLPAGKEYALNVSKKGYLFHSENFEMIDKASYDKPYRKDVELEALVPGAEITLNNVFFDTDKATLKPKSRVELDKLAAFLEGNPDLKVQFEGHTDNQGSPAHNMDLSKRRAKAVYDYIVEQGIVADRLQYKGFGETKPIADNNTEEGRAKNRRTVCRVL